MVINYPVEETLRCSRRITLGADEAINAKDFRRRCAALNVTPARHGKPSLELEPMVIIRQPVEN